MEKINLKKVIEEKSPSYFDGYPGFISKLIIKLLERILHLKEINAFFDQNADKKGLEFIDEIFETLGFSYLLSSRDRLKIPYEGKLICVSNHPLGALDGLTVLKALRTIRHDVKIVANDVLLKIENLNEFFLPYDVFSQKTQKKRFMGIKNALLNEQAVIFFPAAEVSRLTIRGIRDKKWLNGPLYFARKFQVPILPIYIKGKNSLLFYLISLINKNLSMFLLAHEIMRKRSKSITLKIGDPIPSQHVDTSAINSKYQTKLLKKHVYRIGKNTNWVVFKTEKTIIHPVDRKLIKNDLSNAELLSVTSDGKKIYIVEFKNNKHILREIFRLREVTFRKVGEGTGNKYDFDQYDKWYRHIVLWDDESLEIVGSYRLGLCKEIIVQYGEEGIYNASMFHFSTEFKQYLMNAVELGRSFIQQK